MAEIFLDFLIFLAANGPPSAKWQLMNHVADDVPAAAEQDAARLRPTALESEQQALEPPLYSPQWNSETQ
jgi:hypothetical protein